MHLNQQESMQVNQSDKNKNAGSAINAGPYGVFDISSQFSKFSIDQAAKMTKLK